MDCSRDNSRGIPFCEVRNSGKTNGKILSWEDIGYSVMPIRSRTVWLVLVLFTETQTIGFSISNS